MKVSYAGNVLTINTEINKVLFEANKDAFTVTSDKGAEVYKISALDKPSISKFGLSCNAVVGEELAVVIIEPVGTTVEQVKAKYGVALMDAEAHINSCINHALDINARVEAVFN